MGRLTEGGITPTDLRQVDVPAVSNRICNQPIAYGGSVTKRMLCAGFAAGGKDSCQGEVVVRCLETTTQLLARLCNLALSLMVKDVLAPINMGFTRASVIQKSDSLLNKKPLSKLFLFFILTLLNLEKSQTEWSLG